VFHLTFFVTIWVPECPISAIISRSIWILKSNLRIIIIKDYNDGGDDNNDNNNDDNNNNK